METFRHPSIRGPDEEGLLLQALERDEPCPICPRGLLALYVRDAASETVHCRVCDYIATRKKTADTPVHPPLSKEATL